MDHSMHADVRRGALQREYDALANSPDRPAKFRRLNEIGEQLDDLGETVDRVEAPEGMEDTSDRTPRRRAVRGRTSKES